MEKTAFGLIAALGAAIFAPQAVSATANPADKILNPTSVAELLDPVATLNAMQSERQLEAVEVDDLPVAEDMVMPPHHRVIIIRRHHHHHTSH